MDATVKLPAQIAGSPSGVARDDLRHLYYLFIFSGLTIGLVSIQAIGAICMGRSVASRRDCQRSHDRAPTSPTDQRSGRDGIAGVAQESG